MFDFLDEMFTKLDRAIELALFYLVYKSTILKNHLESLKSDVSKLVKRQEEDDLIDKIRSKGDKD